MSDPLTDMADSPPRSDSRAFSLGRAASGRNSRPPRLYADPNGELPIEAIRNLTQRFDKLDVLLNVSANTYKRVKTVHGKPGLLESLEPIGKEYRYMAEPRSDWQWTFILLTNWAEYKGIKEIGFYSERTAHGQAVRDKISLTKRELSIKAAAAAAAGQQELPW